MQTLMNWLLVEQRENPSSDYFVKPFLAQKNLKLASLASTPPIPPDSGLNVVFVRYLTPKWKHWLKKYRNRLGKVAFFMDDDLFDTSTHWGLPLHYRWKLYRLSVCHQAWLQDIHAELWVSTSWLANKYSYWQPRILTPQSPYTCSSPQKTFFYHGSASHAQEIKWLLPVVEDVILRVPTLSFELIGNKNVRKLFSHIPRVYVLQPMCWSTYKALISTPRGYVIGLAPLLPNSFNNARSFTKFFDITQSNAIGIYADHPVYRSVIRDKENGILLPMKQQEWADAIVDLYSSDAKRIKLLSKAKSSLSSLQE